MKKHKFINLRIAHHTILLWFMALVITISSVIYQRMTGPTYPRRGKITIGENMISFKLLRTETVPNNAPINLTVPDTAIAGYVQMKRFKSDDDWTNIPLQREEEKLIASLPHQPAAGKLMYFVYLEKDGQEYSLTAAGPIILRYKGDVPTVVLILHVLTIFLAMLFSNRTALEALDAEGRSYHKMLWTIGLFFIGGMILGPLVQKFAFNAWWTGFPLGKDLTDTKTLIAMVGWFWAWYKNRRGRDGRIWILFAAVLMFVVYLIPHSVLGSELDYRKLPQ